MLPACWMIASIPTAATNQHCVAQHRTPVYQHALELVIACILHRCALHIALPPAQRARPEPCCQKGGKQLYTLQVVVLPIQAAYHAAVRDGLYPHGCYMVVNDHEYFATGGGIRRFFLAALCFSHGCTAQSLLFALPCGSQCWPV